MALPFARDFGAAPRVQAGVDRHRVGEHFVIVGESAREAQRGCQQACALGCEVVPVGVGAAHDHGEHVEGGIAQAEILDQRIEAATLAAMSDVRPEESGLASGLVNTSFMMGGALGLAVLASIAASRSHSLRLGGAGELSALTGGYHLAFLVGAAFAAAAAVIGGALLREAEPMAAHEPGHGAAAATETS